MANKRLFTKKLRLLSRPAWPGIVFALLTALALSAALTWTVLAEPAFTGDPAPSSDWDPGDPAKWVQMPDLDGWDVGALNRGEHHILADDWLCDETGPVEDIHFWVSWSGSGVGDIVGDGINLWICEDDNGKPASDCWERSFNPISFTVRPWPETGLQGWYNPWQPYSNTQDHTEIYQINIEDIEDPFIQEEGNTYWLAIEWIQVDGGFVGWKTSEDHRLNNAVYKVEGWIPLEDPATEERLDFAFVIGDKGAPVGGMTAPTSTSDLLSPWLALAALMAVAVAAAVALKRRTA